MTHCLNSPDVDEVVVPHQDVFVRDPAPHTALHQPPLPVLAVHLDTGVVQHLAHHHTGHGLAEAGVVPGQALVAVGQADSQVLAQVDALAKQAGLVEVLLQAVVEDAVEVVQSAPVEGPVSLPVPD